MTVLLVSGSFGFDYGNSNQNTYLIEGLVKLDSSFLVNDWFARETTHHHPTFAYLIKALSYFGSIPWGTAIVNFTLIALSLFFIYRLILLLDVEHRLYIWGLLLFFVVLEETKSVGMTYLFNSFLQPSSPASAMFIIAIVFWVQGKYFYSGLALGGAGWFHSNYLLLGFLFLGLPHILRGRQNLAKRLLLQFGLSGLLLAAKLPFLFHFVDSEQGRLSRDILLYIRSPHHYIPMSFWRDFVRFFGWHFIALACLGRIRSGSLLRRRFSALYISFLALLLLAIVFTTVFFIPAIAQLFFWRMAPFSVILAQLICLSAFAHLVCSQKIFCSSYFTARLFLGGMGGFLLFWSYYYYLKMFYLHKQADYRLLFFGGTFLMIVAALHAVALKRGLKEHWLPKAFFKRWLPFLLLGVVLLGVAKPVYSRSTLLNGFPGDAERALYEWVNQTESNTVFLIPPNLENFRLHGERAVVVDWKSTSVEPKSIVEWYRRICNISGNDSVTSQDDACKSYSLMTDERLSFLAQKYQVQYAVFWKTALPKDLRKEIVYSNSLFVVYAVRSLNS